MTYGGQAYQRLSGRFVLPRQPLGCRGKDKITMNPFKILIVEDSLFFRQLFKETLRSRFPAVEISEAADGQEALKSIESRTPDLVFMDIKLPGENGLEVTKKIKVQYPKIIVVILSAYDLPEYREAAYDHNATYFLSKGSSSKEEILSLVESIMGGRLPVSDQTGG